MAETRFNSKIECFSGSGIKLEFTSTFNSKLNGVSKRMNRILVEKAGTILNEVKPPNELWGKALKTATYLVNASPTVAFENKTPFKMWYKREPDKSKLRIFG